MSADELRKAAGFLRHNGPLPLIWNAAHREVDLGPVLADWLLVQAHHVASRDCEAHCEYPDGCDETATALTLARLINGGAS